MRLYLAILLGKLISFISRTLKIGGGSAAPGLYALKIEPDLVEKLAGFIPKNVIITGTNGKTTTARILAHLAKEAGLKIIRNPTGSNLERGIASALISGAKLNHLNHPEGGLRWHLGVWELDEFAFNEVAPKLKPDLILFLNVSRDQLDRYGEIDKVVDRWCKTISKLNPKTIILINPDLAKLKNYFKGETKEFGKVKNIKTDGLNGTSFEFQISNFKFQISMPVPGMYNVLNATAAITAAYYLNIPITPLNNFQPAFGRFEKLPFGYIFLIKNPAGATQVFETIAPLIKPNDRLLLALNDNLADGTDVSWIWDAVFEILLQKSSRAKSRDLSLYVSGNRAHDLAVRLKYAGFEPDAIEVEPSLKKALKRSREGLKGKLFILPTYTCMLELQQILAKMGIKKHYWRE
ncbi:MAG: UDP-N-acetylmuramyl tripeptide synthase [Microgenomates group bacterium Gr01-1014_7]|nr:MAG: UDP-N-acetylmuramyl tripeptide synthase [Microgenomates group bacterium Gr01-1014_7]